MARTVAPAKVARRTRDEDAPRKRAAPTKRPARDEETRPARSRRTARADRPSVTEGLRPIKRKQTQVERIDAIAETAGVDRKTAKEVLLAYRENIIRHLMPGSLEEYSEAGLFKIFTKHVAARTRPAQRAGEKKVNPFTGQSFITEATPAKKIPATIKCRMRPQRKLKEAVLGN